ncbi:TetR/AcrR family transcriptional regulator [Alkalicoccobacillus murimartini]|uniref:TetR/AcrR family transcriptional repressor of nem operon n=1 Tax=Alkalicoccobacillus murimartini TaxID=171685 RepID=A0ABT9YMU6_9BACI|nr:TetR/AcrR family transcriptional regulator [Alkalicoccobacillus murimartini]MDQ0208816.1 TetR/AcrR family transcriptional repressor of nem operon [Alkalicoccobacillus murimartini]
MKNRKEQIITLAVEKIQEMGYRSFSYDDLSKELHVTKASIHYHFEKKEDLGLAVCSYLREGLEELINEINHSSIQVKDRPYAFILRRIEHISSTGICPITAFQADMNELTYDLQEAVTNVSQLEANSMVRLVGDAKKDGAIQGIKKEEIEDLSWLLLSTIKGGLQYQRAINETVLEKILSQVRLLLK